MGTWERPQQRRFTLSLRLQAADGPPKGHVQLLTLDKMSPSPADVVLRVRLLPLIVQLLFKPVWTVNMRRVSGSLELSPALRGGSVLTVGPTGLFPAGQELDLHKPQQKQLFSPRPFSYQLTVTWLQRD